MEFDKIHVKHCCCFLPQRKNSEEATEEMRYDYERKSLGESTYRSDQLTKLTRTGLK